MKKIIILGLITIIFLSLTLIVYSMPAEIGEYSTTFEIKDPDALFINHWEKLAYEVPINRLELTLSFFTPISPKEDMNVSCNNVTLPYFSLEKNLIEDNTNGFAVSGKTEEGLTIIKTLYRSPVMTKYFECKFRLRHRKPSTFIKTLDHDKFQFFTSVRSENLLIDYHKIIVYVPDEYIILNFTPKYDIVDIIDNTSKSVKWVYGDNPAFNQTKLPETISFNVTYGKPIIKRPPTTTPPPTTTLPTTTTPSPTIPSSKTSESKDNLKIIWNKFWKVADQIAILIVIIGAIIGVLKKEKIKERFRN